MLHLSTMDAFKNLKSGDLTVVDDEMLKNIQRVLLGILDDIVAVCEKYGIVYTLGGGSVLGAVRHRGFIPWDDDIDINFSRREYERFIPAFQEEFGEKYWIHTPENTDNYGLLFARVRLKGTVLKTRDDFWTEECGAFIDLFILENTFDNAALRWLHGMGCQVLGLLLSCRKFYRDRKYMMALARNNPALMPAFRVKIALGFFTALGSVNFWTRLANRWSALCKDDNSVLVATPAGRKKFWGELYRRSDMLEAVKMEFEGRKVNCPRNYEMYLTHMYGDYMTIPPEEDRERHPFFGEILLRKDSPPARFMAAGRPPARSGKRTTARWISSTPEPAIPAPSGPPRPYAYPTARNLGWIRSSSVRVISMAPPSLRVTTGHPPSLPETRRPVRTS